MCGREEGRWGRGAVFTCLRWGRGGVTIFLALLDAVASRCVLALSGRELGGVHAAGDGAGHLHQLQERAAGGSSQGQCFRGP